MKTDTIIDNEWLKTTVTLKELKGKGCRLEKIWTKPKNNILI